MSKSLFALVGMNLAFGALLLSACGRDAQQTQCETSKRIREQWMDTAVETRSQLHAEIDDVVVNRPCAIDGAILHKILLDMDRLR